VRNESSDTLEGGAPSDMNNRSFSQGAEITAHGVSFRTWATRKKNLSVVILDSRQNLIRETPLEWEPSGYASLLDLEAASGTLYQYRVDGQLLPDPASRFQPRGVHGPSQVIDPRSFTWTDQEWKAPTLSDLIIYELHVGTFTQEGTFDAVIPRLGHLRKLGITAIELMPIADFAGDRNWGYDGVSLYAPSRAYGTPDELRAFVNAAHESGLAVILDVVYNHLGPDGNYLGAYSDQYFNPSHHTPWGDAFNLDSPGSEPVRNHFAENPVYWIKEFHIDGFRLDATQAIPDDSPKHLIQEIAERVQALGGFVICEDPRNERKIILPRDKGGYGCDAVWADDFHHVVRVQMTREDEGYMGYFKGTMEELLKTESVGWLFTGELQKDAISRGTPGDDIPPQHFVHCISNHDQVGNRARGDRLHQTVSPASYRAASALLLLGPYTPMLFMGQEWGTSSPFLYFTDHHDELGKGVTEGRRKEFADFSEFRDPAKRNEIPDPQALESFERSKLLWEELNDAGPAKLLRLYEDFLRFRKDRLRDRDRTHWTVSQVSDWAIALRYRYTNEEILILVQLVPCEAVVDADRLRPANRREWKFTMSSNESIYGGEHLGCLDPERRRFLLSQPEVIVFSAA
jgi:maltooligosyltrehalose trehalohydrolase